MKKKKKKKVPIEAETNHFEFFRLLMFHLGTTYPKHIFDRRVQLLTEKEYKKYDKRIIKLIGEIYDKFKKETDDIDGIMANRAEKENDPWK